MHYIVYVRLAQFYVSCLEAQDPTLSVAPLVVMHEKRVIDLNAHALTLGIRRGMPQSEAKTLLKSGGTCISYEPEPFREAQRAWLDVLAEFTDCIEPRLPHEAFADFSGHPAANEVALQAQNRLAEVTGLGTQVGFARSKWVAELSAASGSSPAELQVVWERPDLYLAPLSVMTLAPVEFEDRRRLRFLGYRTIADVAALSPKILKPQFGHRTFTLLDAIAGGPFEPVRPDYPEDRALVIIQEPTGISDQEQVDLLIQRAAARLQRQLGERDRYGTELEIEVELASGKKLRRTRVFSKPIAKSRAAEVALRLIWPQVQEEICSLRVEIHRLERIVRRQSCLDGAVDKGEREVTTDLAFKTLRKVYGDHAIKVAAEVPVARRVQVLRVWSDVLGWR